MRVFYTILFWLSDRELTIALSTGRNPDHIAKLRGDVARWNDALDYMSLENFTVR